MKIVENKKVEVSIELFQELVNYLQMKPYHEVHELIQKIIIASNKEK